MQTYWLATPPPLFWCSASKAPFLSLFVCSCSCKCSWIFPCWRHSPSSPAPASFPPFLTGPTPLSLQPNVPVSWVQLASSWAGHWQEVEAMRSPVSLYNAISCPLQSWWSASQISLLFQEQVGWGTWLVQCALSLVLNSPLSNQSLHMIFI